MEERQEQQCASIGMKISLLCATLGAIAPVGIMLHEFFQYLPGGVSARMNPGLTQVKWSILLGVIVTLSALYLAAAFLGRAAGKNICRRRRSLGGAIFVGTGLALFCLLVGLIVMALFMAATSPGKDDVEFIEGVVGVFVFVSISLMVGAVPAILLGILYGVLMRWRLTKAGCWKANPIPASGASPFYQGMKIIHDDEANASYLSFTPVEVGGVAETIPAVEMNVELDENNQVATLRLFESDECKFKNRLKYVLQHPHVSYDEAQRNVVLSLAPASEVRKTVFWEGNIDLDDDGQILGLEILFADAGDKPFAFPNR
jgi:uncharacterized protein YuzE